MLLWTSKKDSLRGVKKFVCHRQKLKKLFFLISAHPEQVPEENGEEEAVGIVPSVIRTRDELIAFNNRLQDPVQFEAAMKADEEFYVPGGRPESIVVRHNLFRLLHVELRSKCVTKRRINVRQDEIVLEECADKVIELVFKSTAKAFKLPASITKTVEMENSYKNVIQHSKGHYRQYLKILAKAAGKAATSHAAH